jgi:hypothetical protein
VTRLSGDTACIRNGVRSSLTNPSTVDISDSRGCGDDARLQG